MNTSKFYWQQYHAFEREFLDWLSEKEVTTLLSGYDRTYGESLNDDGSKYYIPPKYIRAIAILHDECRAEYDERYNELLSLHQDAINSIKRPLQQLPFRTPTIINEPIEHVSISVKKAYKSLKIKKNKDVYLMNYPLELEMQNYTLAALNSYGLELIIEPQDTPQFIHATYDSFIRLCGHASNIQSRYLTGSQYNVRLRELNASSGKMHRHGYLLLRDIDQDIDIVYANQQAERPHKLDKTYRKIQLPFETVPTFYNLDDPIIK